MKKTLIIMLFAAVSAVATVSFAEPSNVCRWTSESDCKDKDIGSSCSNSGTCLVKEWVFSEPVCKCYEKPDDSKSYCRWTSDSECKGKLPGRVQGGVCKIKSVSFDEPECIFVKG